MTLYDYCAERDELVLLTQWAPVKNRTLTPREGSYEMCIRDRKYTTTPMHRRSTAAIDHFISFFISVDPALITW